MLRSYLSKGDMHPACLDDIIQDEGGTGKMILEWVWLSNEVGVSMYHGRDLYDKLTVSLQNECE